MVVVVGDKVWMNIWKEMALVPLEMHLRPPAWIAALLNALCNTYSLPGVTKRGSEFFVFQIM